MTVEYSLFRVKFIRPAQASLLPGAETNSMRPDSLLMRCLEQRPSAELRAGFQWHIGNVRTYTPSSGYFAIGRTTTSTVEKFDASSGNFVEEELEESPYTHCVFDASVGLIGIAKKTQLSQTTKGIAGRLEQLLSVAEAVVYLGITVEVRPIPDPESFLGALSEAFRVARFSATFRGPNPFDADEYFQKPLSAYLNAAHGSQGRTTINGEDLDRDVLREVTRSTAATGNEASARLQKTRRQKLTTINLRGNPLRRKFDEAEHDPREAVRELRALYDQVRLHEDR